jgi:hypothetical protein
VNERLSKVTSHALLMPAAATRYMCVLRTAVFKAYGLLTRLATMRLGVPEFLPHEVSLFIAFSRILRDFNACVNAGFRSWGRQYLLRWMLEWRPIPHNKCGQGGCCLLSTTLTNSVCSPYVTVNILSFKGEKVERLCNMHEEVHHSLQPHD